MLAVDNLISAIIFALNNPVTIGETYLVADSKAMTIGEILTMLRKIQGRSSSTISVPQIIVRLLLIMCGRKDVWVRLSGDLVVDTSKLESVGWRSAIDTYEGLRGRCVLKTANPDRNLDGSPKCSGKPLARRGFPCAFNDRVTRARNLC